MQVQSLGWEDPLEEEMATHPSIPTWRIPWTEASVQEIWNHRRRSCSSVVSPYLWESPWAFQARGKQIRWHGDTHPLVSELMSGVYGSLRRRCCPTQSTVSGQRMQDPHSVESPHVRVCRGDPSSPAGHSKWPSAPLHLPSWFLRKWVCNESKWWGCGLHSEPVEQCVQLIVQNLAHLVLVWLLFVRVVWLWAAHWILCLSFLICKPGEEQLDVKAVQRLFTRKLMRYKILPRVLPQSQHARNIFTGDILVFNTVVFDCKAKQLACILSHPLLVLWLPMIYWTTVCLRSVCTVGMTAPPSCGRKELGAKDFPLCQSHRRSWKHWLVWLTSQC